MVTPSGNHLGDIYLIDPQRGSPIPCLPFLTLVVVFCFVLFAYRCPVVPEPFIEETIFFSVVLPWLPCQRPVDYIYGDLFLVSLFCSINLFVYSFTNATLS